MEQPAQHVGTSKRWKHFHSALQLATQRASNKWTFQDFQECFPLWCSEEPDGAEATMSLIARKFQEFMQANTEELLRNPEYNAAETIDSLHAVVTDARELLKAHQQQSPDTPFPLEQDTWREDLEPRAAVRARVVPVLLRQKQQMEQQLAELENDNRDWVARIEALKATKDEDDARTSRLLDALDNTVDAFANLRQDDIVEWTQATQEALGSEYK